MTKSKSPVIPSENSLPKLSDEKPRSLRKKNNVKSDVEMVPPDGGWGWMIVIGSLVITVLGFLPGYGFSIIFSPIVMSNGVSSAKTAWIFNFFTLNWNAFILFVGPLCEQFGSRKLAMFGGIAGSLSVLLSAFVPTADYLFFTFSLLGGIGGSIIFALSYMVVSSYFKKNIGLALGITTVGGSLSIFLAPVVSNYLLEHFGYTGAAMIFGAILLNQCVGAMLYQPVEWHMKPIKPLSVVEKYSKEPIKLNGDLIKETNEKTIDAISLEKAEKETTNYENKNQANEVIPVKQTLARQILKVLKSTFNNLKSLKYMRVNFIAFSYFFFYVGFSNFLIWVPFVITDAGYSLEIASWISSLASVGSVLGRVLMSLLSDRKFFNLIHGLMIGLFIIGSSTIVFSFLNDVRLFIIFSCFWGFGVGLVFASIGTVMIKVMGTEMFPAVFGVSGLFTGLGGFIVGPLIGAVRDATQNYKYSLWMLGGLEFLSFSMWILMPLGKKFDNWKYEKTEEKEESQNC